MGAGRRAQGFRASGLRDFAEPHRGGSMVEARMQKLSCRARVDSGRNEWFFARQELFEMPSSIVIQPLRGLTRTSNQ